MNRIALALSMLCCVVSGCYAEPTIDEKTEHWVRIAVVAGDRAVTFAVPHGYGFEGGGDPRPPNRVDLTAAQTDLFNAAYEPGSGQDADLPLFQIYVSLVKYRQPRGDAGFDELQGFASALDETRRAGLLGVPLPEVQSTEVTLGERQWLLLTGPKGPNVYATPFSRTHALLVGASFWGKTKHSPEWWAARRRIIEAVAKSIVMTEQK